MQSARFPRWAFWLAGAGVACVAVYLLFVLVSGNVGSGSTLEAQSPPAPRVAPAPSFDPSDALLGTDSSVSTQEMQLVLVATAPGRTPREGTATLGTDPRNPQTYAAGAR